MDLVSYYKYIQCHVHESNHNEYSFLAEYATLDRIKHNKKQKAVFDDFIDCFSRKGHQVYMLELVENEQGVLVHIFCIALSTDEKKCFSVKDKILSQMMVDWNSLTCKKNSEDLICPSYKQSSQNVHNRIFLSYIERFNIHFSYTHDFNFDGSWLHFL